MTAGREPSAPKRRVVVLTTPELAPGYRLAGVATLTAGSAAEAMHQLRALIEEEQEQGVVAVHEPYLEEIEPRARRRLEASTSPLVVALPSGDAEAGAAARRQQLLTTLWRAIGYQISFPSAGEK